MGAATVVVLVHGKRWIPDGITFENLETGVQVFKCCVYGAANIQIAICKSASYFKSRLVKGDTRAWR